MMKFLKGLWRDRRGNALVIAGAALPLVVGSAGLASDTIQWTLWKRQLQRAADSAAIAGVYAKFYPATETVTASVTTDVARNNTTYAALVGAPQIEYPDSTTAYVNAVKVTLQARKALGFSSLFLSAAPLINATATAAAVNDGSFCAVGLDSSTTPAVRTGGSATVNLGCGVISNSTSPTESVDVDGASYTLIANPVAGVGGMPSSINGSTDIQPRHLPQPDPFANQYSTDIPSSASCTNFNQKILDTTVTGTGSSRITTYTMQPGCYNGFGTGPNTYVLSPGVYYLNSTDFVVNGGTTITGTGVTIILTGTSPGSLQINGNSTIQLTAPTASTAATATSPAVVGTCGTFYGTNSCNYEKMLFIQSANATTGNTNVINGNNGSFIDGAIYFPKGEVQFTGDSGAATKCAMVVGFRLAFSGNTNLQNNTTGCAANKQVTGKAIRLIA